MLATLRAACAASLLVMATLVGACTDAGLCTRGVEGCACRASNACDTGLSCKQGMCVRGTAADGGTRDGGRPDGGTPDAGGPDAGGPDAGGPDAGPGTECAGEDRDAACGEFCEAFCQNQQRLCVASECPANACDPGGAVLDACLMTCDDAACGNDLCELEGVRTCESFGFEDMGIFMAGCLMDDPICVLNPELGCSDTCGSNRVGSGGDFAGDAVCDDGSGGADQYCPRGTDCTDCEASDACRAPGDTCADNFECCGYFVDEPNAGSFCVSLDSEASCLLSCTQTGACPDGFDCFETDDGSVSVCAPSP